MQNLRSQLSGFGWRRAAWSAVCLAAGLALIASPARAQRKRMRTPSPAELHGSKESVEKMYSFAEAHGLTFYLTPTNLDSAIKRGRLVRLDGGGNYGMKSDVGFSYATREAREFVIAFAPQYQAACGAQMLVTSAARPMSKQPRNANPHSVHPTGIAVDIRRPPAGPCLNWLRATLATLENRGLIEATEERHPVHIHIAVLVPPGSAVTLPQLTNTQLVVTRGPGAAPAATGGR
jgi:hypothetical protein